MGLVCEGIYRCIHIILQRFTASGRIFANVRDHEILVDPIIFKNEKGAESRDFRFAPKDLCVASDFVVSIQSNP